MISGLPRGRPGSRLRPAMNRSMLCRAPFAVGVAVLLAALPAAAQIDAARAARYFAEADVLCRAEGGRLWKVSLCGPMVFVDAATRSVAANQPAPAAKLPDSMPVTNTAIEWGGVRWSMIVWQMVPEDQRLRARLMLHELWHRIQPEIGLAAREGRNEHLDTAEGRYWLQLEWRALAAALSSTGTERAAALRDALGFRLIRHKLALTAAEGERSLEMNEGLAAYTGIAASSATPAEAMAAALDALSQGANQESFVRSFAYASGPAYGVLLDIYSPGWTRLLRPGDDLGHVLMAATAVQPDDARTTFDRADRYEGQRLMAIEDVRARRLQERVAQLRRLLVEGPVLVLPARELPFSFDHRGMAALPGAGTVYAALRATAAWGILEVSNGVVLVTAEGDRFVVPVPAGAEGAPLAGHGWTLKLEPGWDVQPGSRRGDWVVAHKTAGQP